MEFYYIVVVVVILVGIFAVNSVKYAKQESEKLKNKIEKNWGKPNKRKYDEKDFRKIKTYFERHKDDVEFYIDDITWQDLDMDSVFKMLNNTYSSAGEEYLYNLLRTPEFNQEKLKIRSDLADKFRGNKEKTFNLQKIFRNLGRTKSIALSEVADSFDGIKKGSNIRHIIQDILFFLFFITLFFKPIVGLIGVIAMLVVNISSYFSSQTESGDYMIFIKYLVDMMKCGNEILKEDVDFLEDYNKILKKDIDSLKGINKRLWLISSGSSGDLLEVFMVYIRMIFHVDIIKFNNIADRIKDNVDSIVELYTTLGIIESDIAIASFREMDVVKCIPEFTKTKVIEGQDMYHPLIEKPVANSIAENKSILITGSNASGKSTFLRTVAINGILAQTIYTCTAKSFKTCFYKIISSMSLADSLKTKESYYMVEIKSIKRIFDSMGDVPILCFVDEVLRGTNTVERIAASSYILKTLADGNCMCFAATHDIELTEILENVFSNYHFTEEVEENDIHFSYKILTGKATSRNAIKLLQIMGFEKNIVDNAMSMSERFENSGQWKL
ncbi:MAG: hypothetical protein II653_05270 [Lachnospiraceae bacterium]|nr:hypothetical protein [Lachnospiraceae bacterium]